MEYIHLEAQLLLIFKGIFNFGYTVHPEKPALISQSAFSVSPYISFAR